MATPRRYNPKDNMSDLSLSNTAYHGAEGYLDDLVPTLRPDKEGYHDVRLGENTPSPLRAAGGLGAALTRSGSVLHSRARSWAQFVPKLNGSPSSTPSTLERPKQRPQSRIFGDIFQGESAPVKLGVPTSPTKDKDEDTEFVMEYRSGFTERPAVRQRRQSAMRNVTPTPAMFTAANRKQSWFARKVSTPAPVITTSQADDEMLNVNINSSLFPHGPADPLSPQAFNDLLLNATNLLSRMQSAYKEKADFIASIQPELDAQKEEVEEARTRSEHLKMQLEDIGRKAEEQRQVNEELIIQLSAEKMRLQEAQEAAKTIRLVPSRRDTDCGAAECSDTEHVQRRRKRTSGASTSDSGFESDADTSSLFSAGIATPISEHMSRLGVTAPNNPLRYASSRESRISQQSTAYSRNNGHPLVLGGGGGGLGDESSFAAWATVENLRHENRELKMQVEQMQSNLQGVIDFVGGVNTGR